MTPLWTIAILTVPGREHFLDRLMAVLQPQLEFHPVDIIIIKDDRRMSIGAKRQVALNTCRAKYISFIDDDDLVAARYVELIMAELRKDVDGVGFRGIVTSRNNTPIEFVHKAGLKYSAKPENYQGTWVYTRPLNHLNPVITDIAREIGYKDISMAEDLDYCQRLDASGLVTHAAFVDAFMYFYQYREGKNKI